MKTCTRCRSNLSISNFYPNHRSTDKLSSVCKSCQLELSAINYQKTKSDPHLYRRLRLKNSVAQSEYYQRKKLKNEHSL